MSAIQKETQRKLYRIVSRIMKVPIERITENSSPKTLDKWDSLQHMNLVLAIEKEFGIHFEAEQISEILSTSLILNALKGMGIH